MNTLRLSYIKENGSELSPFLLGSLISRIILSDSRRFFYATSDYKESKYGDWDEKSFKLYKGLDYLDNLNKFSGDRYWYKKQVLENKRFDSLPRASFIAIVENDLDFNQIEYYQLLERIIFSCDWCNDFSFNDGKKWFIRGFVEIRGSIDATRNLIAQDYYYHEINEVFKAQRLFSIMGIDKELSLNINFRELQGQHISGINKRNTQLRLNGQQYMEKIGLFNKYKANIYMNAFNQPLQCINGIWYTTVIKNFPVSNESNFYQYLKYYSKYVLNKDLSSDRINDIRDILKFNKDDTINSRNRQLIKTFNQITDDKCAICDLEETFISNLTGRHSFDVHHVISNKNGNSLDVLDNLVKVCNNCHSMMKRGRGKVDDQINANIKILQENERVYEFCSLYLNIDDIEELAIEIQDMLG